MKCLLRGTNWVFKYKSVSFVLKGLKQYEHYWARRRLGDAVALHSRAAWFESRPDPEYTD